MFAGVLVQEVCHKCIFPLLFLVCFPGRSVGMEGGLRAGAGSVRVGRGAGCSVVGTGCWNSRDLGSATWLQRGWIKKSNREIMWYLKNSISLRCPKHFDTQDVTEPRERFLGRTRHLLVLALSALSHDPPCRPGLAPSGHLHGKKKTSPDPKHLDRTMFSYKAEWSFPGKFTRNEFLEQQLHLVRIPLPWWGPWEDLLSPRVPRGHVETWLASCGFWFIQQKLEKKKATAFLSPFLLLLLLFFLVFLLSLLTFLFSSSFSPPPSFLLLLAVDAGWLKCTPLYIIFHKIFWIFKTYFHCVWDFITEKESDRQQYLPSADLLSGLKPWTWNSILVFHQWQGPKYLNCSLHTC